MSESKPLIDPSRLGTFVAVNFILTLIAIALAYLAYSRATQTAAATQSQILQLDKRLDALEAKK